MSPASTQRYYHQPVQARRVLEELAVRPGGWYVDCTVGEGGHAATILDASTPSGRLLGIDADPQALDIARRRLEGTTPGAALLVSGNFANIAQIAQAHAFFPVDSVLFDLGLSSLQLEGEERGFTFLREQPLDMRFDPAQETAAADLVNDLSERDLAQLLWEYGEERRSQAIARAIVRLRPLRTTRDLANAVAQATGPARGRIHPATRTFQALRIAVNQEMDSLRQGLAAALGLLKSGGRLVVISYHSLEDRIVKEYLRREATDCICPQGSPACICGHTAQIRLVQRKAILSTREEIASNRRSRSARLRVAERLELPAGGKPYPDAGEGVLP